MGLFGKKKEASAAAATLTYPSIPKPPHVSDLPDSFQPRTIWDWAEGIIQQANARSPLAPQQYVDQVEGLVAETQKYFVDRLLPLCSLEEQQEYVAFVAKDPPLMDCYRWIAAHVPDVGAKGADMMRLIGSRILA